MGSQDQKPSRAERIAKRAYEMKVKAAGLTGTDPEASEDALREAARLRAEAREAHAQEQAAKAAQDAEHIDAIRLARQGRLLPGGIPLRGTEGAA